MQVGGVHVGGVVLETKLVGLGTRKYTSSNYPSHHLSYKEISPFAGTIR